ncbi:DNA damage-inducible protein D [Patescibacteria group bacterium]|nr:DNA damage-inducible protein D [Patescibacteria group bacterium]MBU1123045.1 DNA damage-inducible protein D [Patescibacteria group bacterium]MBU1911073.1 DNA damage-inducible protein D [Patescibacteria group bacterium]
MQDLTNLLPSARTTFESIKHVDADGIEYWEARELMPLLDYGKWENFHKVICKAKKACTASSQDVLDHFPEIRKPIKAGKGVIQEVLDYKLSRYACYLIAQNGDSSKQPIALAQTYFAVQTRKHELYEGLTEDEKRLLIREEVTDHNKKLFKTAKDSGVRNFGRFNDAGYKGLYGMTSKEIQKAKKLGRDKLLDRAGATELAANLFRITQTDEQLNVELDEGKRIGESKASRTHFVVGGKVRKAIKDIGGTMPEKLPPEEHIIKLEKRIDGKLKGKSDIDV